MKRCIILKRVNVGERCKNMQKRCEQLQNGIKNFKRCEKYKKVQKDVNWWKL